MAYYRVLACEMGRPVLIRMVHCDPVRLSEEQSDEYETVVHPGASRVGHTVLYVSNAFHLSPRIRAMLTMLCFNKTISIFNAAVDLFRIVERVLSEVHSVASLSTIRASRERLVTELDRELEEWQKSLGLRCKYPSPDDRTPTRSLYLCHGVR